MICDVLLLKTGILSYYITCDHEMIPNPFVEVFYSIFILKTRQLYIADFAPAATFWRTQPNTVWHPTGMVPPSHKLFLSITSSVILSIGPMIWKHDVIHKLEVHNISQHCQRRTELWPQATCTKNWWSLVVRFLSSASGQTDTQTDTQTSQYFTALLGRSNNNNIILMYGHCKE